MPACPRCGWRSSGVRHPSRFPGLILRLSLAAAAGLAAGAILAHSLLLVLYLFIVLGPITSAMIGRRSMTGGWLLVLTYSLGLGSGLLLFPDGQTISAGAWGTVASAVAITAVVGLVANWISSPD